jgi:hypothetical protein
MAVQNANSVNITGGSITGIADLPVADGGTGASTAVQARLNLGLGNLAVQADNNVSITGGQIYGLSTPLPVASGGTGQTTIPGIRTTLGLGNLALENAPLSVSLGGTGATDAATARTNLGAAASATAVTVGSGLTGGGTLNASFSIGIDSTSNGFGVRYVSSATPTGGNNGDIWYKI